MISLDQLPLKGEARATLPRSRVHTVRVRAVTPFCLQVISMLRLGHMAFQQQEREHGGGWQ